MVISSIGAHLVAEYGYADLFLSDVLMYVVGSRATLIQLRVLVPA